MLQQSNERDNSFNRVETEQRALMHALKEIDGQIRTIRDVPGTAEVLDSERKMIEASKEKEVDVAVRSIFLKECCHHPTDFPVTPGRDGGTRGTVGEA